VKNRTRALNEGNVKVSYHFIPNIWAPKSIHCKAVAVCAGECKGSISKAAAGIKSNGVLPQELLTNSIQDSKVAWDISAVNNSITTAFSRKQRTGPFSRYVYAEEVCGGCAVGREEFLKNPQDLDTPNITDKERLMLLFRQCYTVQQKEMLCYTASAMETLSEEVFYFFIFFVPTGIRTHTPLVRSYD
jgi:hypothetical protein